MYIVLDSPARDALGAEVGAGLLWWAAAVVAAIDLLVNFVLGWFTF